MNFIEKYILKRILRNEVRQGYYNGYTQEDRIYNLYVMIRDAINKEYTEDNEATKDDYLREWFEKSQFTNLYKKH